MLCSRDRVSLEGNQGSNWTKNVEQVVSGQTGGGGGRGTGSLERGKERKKGLEEGTARGLKWG